MFNPDRALKDHIFDILKNDGMSISALSRELETRGIVLHRLILTGYLRALTDYNYLKEKMVPPAKVYVPVKGRDKDIYEVVGDFSRSLGGPDVDLLILFSLNRLFHRPIFFEEMRRAGIRDMPPGTQINFEEKQETKRLLQKAGIRIQDPNLAYYYDDPALQPRFDELMVSVLSNILGFSNLIKETKQTRLDIMVSEKD